MTADPESLKRAIEALEAQRATLGDAVVDAALAPLRAALKEATGFTPEGGVAADAPDPNPGRAAAEAPDPKAQARRDQRKQVTVLFADISGFTALSETRDAEEVRDVINALWARLDRAIVARGGFVDKHIGDAVMAVFGAPIAREDDAVRAVRAGLALQEELAAFAAGELGMRPDGTPLLRMRVGLHTGPAVLGEVASTAEYTAIGDTVNTASRLEGLAPVGGVLISAATLELVHGLFETQAMPPASVKGKREPVDIALVIAERERVFRDPRRGRAGSLMVGREAELQRLRGAVQRARSDGRVHAVLITGEAGIGKSRLLQTLEDEIRAAGDGLLVLRGRAEPGDADRPYGLVGAALREIDAGDAADPAAAAVMFASGQAPPIVAGPGDGERDQERTWTLIARRLAQVAGGRDLLFLAEDVHWADPSSLGFLRFLRTVWVDGGLAVVATSRTPVDLLPGQEHIDLHGLGDADARTLASSVLGETASDEMLDWLAERGAGNPFFVEELARFLRRTAADSASFDFRAHTPESLVALLQARLDALPPDELKATQGAAVVGDMLWDEAATSVESARDPRSDSDRIRTGLRTLVDERDVLEWRPEADLPAEPEALGMAFRHSLMHGVAYEGVLLRERKPMHRAAADWLAVHGVPHRDFSAQIAAHLERSDQPACSAEWRLQAARSALMAYASEEALSQADRGIAAADPASTGMLFDLRECRREALSRLGRKAAEAEEVGALQALAAGMDDRSRARAWLAASDLAWSTGDYSAAKVAGAQALTAAGGARALDLEGRAHRELGRVAREMGDLEDAERAFEKAQSAYAAAGNDPGRANALLQLGTLAAHRGDVEVAMTRLTEALDVARAIGDIWDESWALDSLAVMQAESGQLDEAIAMGRSAITRADESGLWFREALSRSNLADMLLRAGRPAEAAAEAARAAAASTRLGDEYGAALAQVTEGEAELSRGQADALALLEGAYARAMTVDAPFPAAVASHALSAALLDPPWLTVAPSLEADRGLELAVKGAQLARDAEDPATEALSLAAQALAHAGMGDTSLVAPTVALAEAALGRARRDGTEIRVLATLGRALDLSGLPGAETRYEAATEEVNRRSGQIADAELRKSFLEDVPLHAWLRARPAGPPKSD